MQAEPAGIDSTKVGTLAEQGGTNEFPGNFAIEDTGGTEYIFIQLFIN